MTGKTDHHNLDCFDEFTSRFIRAKARQLVGRAGFGESDYGDLLQDLSLDLLKRRHRFDPGTAPWEAFVVVVCENRCATLLNHRRAEKRSYKREAGSLNRPTNDDNRTEAGTGIHDSQHSLRTGTTQRTHEEASDMISDVEYLINQLPPHFRELCERLKRDSISQVARDMGISTKTVYRWNKRLRKRFEQSRLRHYV